MTQEEIIEMAKQAELITFSQAWGCFWVEGLAVKNGKLEAFAKLVAAKEREACAKVCEDRVPTYLKNGERWLKGTNGKPDVRLKELAPNLEAQWEAEQLLKNKSVVEFITEAHKCAVAIRARGETT